MATINYIGLESEQPPPPPLLIPFKHTLKILTVNGSVVAKGSNRGQNYLELRLRMWVLYDSQWMCLCVRLCCRQLD